MQLDDTRFRLSPTDLSLHLGCRHLTELNRAVAEGRTPPADWHDPALALLRERGFQHERAYIDHLMGLGRRVVDLRDSRSVLDTTFAMKGAADVVVQAPLADAGWSGRADILLRVERPCGLGEWSYEVLDTKLAQETRGGTVLQLCVYTDLLGALQGAVPEHMHVVKPGEGFPTDTFRFADYAAFYRLARRRLEAVVAAPPCGTTYPDPVALCDVCRWRLECERKRHADDHLCLVAGIRPLHIAELQRQGVSTLEQFALEPSPTREKPQRGSREIFAKVQGQARVQLDGRRRRDNVYQLLEPELGRGLARLPEPTAGDVFFDIESDPFVEGGGLEYLLGYTFTDGGDLQYRGLWALDRASEKRAFEHFIDFVMEQWQRHPGMHVYHFSPYEPGALKRLMSRHATREAEVDRLLRGERFVDLLAVTRQGLQASVESYSLKELECFYGFTRSQDLPAASSALRRLAWALEFGHPEEVAPTDREIVEAYNREDCESARGLRDWLEERRVELQGNGHEVIRPELLAGDASEAVAVRTEAAQAVFDQLLEGMPEKPETWDASERARWLLAHQLDYFRREGKCAWWDFFRVRDLEYEDLLEERHAVSGLEFAGEVPGGTAVCPIHRYRFPPQEVGLDEEDNLHEVRGEAIGRVAAVDQAGCTIDIKKRQDSVEIHPTAVQRNEHVSPDPVDSSLLALARSIAEHGADGDGPFQAGRDLLLKRSPRIARYDGGPLTHEGEDVQAAAVRLVPAMEETVLAIQGPPGTGKTHTGARMILELARARKRIGVTAVSHKAIANLLAKVHELADSEGLDLGVVHKVTKKSDDAPDGVVEVTSNSKGRDALDDGHVVGGTAWFWAHDDSVGAVDYLFVDEAGQISLAQTLACARAAKNLVLLGDPQQLEQPKRGAHPEGADIAALAHLLDGHDTMPPDKGLFLDTTRRLHPTICRFTSEVYYENRLHSLAGLERQQVTGPTLFAGAGLFYVSVEHEGNQNRSLEEVEAVEHIVADLLQAGVQWVDQAGAAEPLAARDILVIAPYNAQVAALKERLPDLRVGTVDKFQGQEAAVVIYSLASSSAEDAPRGMSFLYSPNRLNVSTSRARGACILVASPNVFEPECRTPEQMRWANGLCRFRELATMIQL